MKVVAPGEGGVGNQHDDGINNPVGPEKAGRSPIGEVPGSAKAFYGYPYPRQEHHLTTYQF